MFLRKCNIFANRANASSIRSTFSSLNQKSFSSFSRNQGDFFGAPNNYLSPYVLHVLTCNLVTLCRSSLPRLRDVAVFDLAAQPTDDQNPCRRLGNGGCDQLCFSFPPDRTLTKAHFRCDCSTGRVGADGRRCEAEDEFLVFSTRTEVRSISLDPRSTSVPFKPVVSTFQWS